jgi:predicted nucleic acid-binding protein
MTFVDSMYLDTNLLIFSRDRKSAKYCEASMVLADLFINNVNLYITDLVIDEYIWNLLRAYYKYDTGNNLYPSTIKSDPTIVSRYHWRISSGVKKILNFQRLSIVSNMVPPITLIKKAMNLMRSQKMSPRDAFHLSFILNLNIKGIVTSDGDFDGLNIRKHLTIYKY